MLLRRNRTSNAIDAMQPRFTLASEDPWRWWQKLRCQFHCKKMVEINVDLSPRRLSHENTDVLWIPIEMTRQVVLGQSSFLPAVLARILRTAIESDHLPSTASVLLSCSPVRCGGERRVVTSFWTAVTTASRGHASGIKTQQHERIADPTCGATVANLVSV